MSEGGFLAWKRQNITAPPIADYSDLKRPIQLPHGSAWHLDPKTKEWKVIKIQDNTHVAVGIPTAEPICADDKNEPKTACQEAHHVDVVTEKNLIHAESKLSDDGDAKFISHVVQSHDTMQGICLKFHVTPTQLRQMNNFSGSNLLLAPPTLIIRGTQTPNQQTLSPQQIRESKIHSFLFQFRSRRTDVGRKEAVAYLEICDWSVEEAIQDAKDDFGWEDGDLYSEKRSLV